MTAVVEDSTHPVEGALAGLRSLLGQAVQAPVWSLDDRRLVEQVVQAGAVVAQAQALLLRLVGEADARQALLADGAPSGQAWLRHRLRICPAEATSYLRTGRALRAGLQQTGQACAAGRLGLGHATVIARTVAELPADRALRRAAERDLIEHAGSFDPLVLARPGRRLLAVADPDAADTRDGDTLARAEDRAAQRMQLCLTPDGQGGAWLRGRLDPEGAAAVRAALDPLSAPRPTAADRPDPRTPGRRRADALTELCRRALAAGTLPQTGGNPPQVVVTVPPHPPLGHRRHHLPRQRRPALRPPPPPRRTRRLADQPHRRGHPRIPAPTLDRPRPATATQPPAHTRRRTRPAHTEDRLTAKARARAHFPPELMERFGPRRFVALDHQRFLDRRCGRARRRAPWRQARRQQAVPERRAILPPGSREDAAGCARRVRRGRRG